MASAHLAPSTTNRRSAAIAPLVGAATVAYGATAFAIDPYRPRAVGCPVHAMTGGWCPGCGSTRAVHELLHGDVAASVACHPLVVVLVAFVGYLAASAYARAHLPASSPMRRWARHPTELPAGVLYGIAAVFVALTVVRNVDALGWFIPPPSPR